VPNKHGITFKPELRWLKSTPRKKNENLSKLQDKQRNPVNEKQQRDSKMLLFTLPSLGALAQNCGLS